MKKLIIIYVILILSGCGNLKKMTPAERYAKEHDDKRFTTWEDRVKEVKKARQ